METNDIITNLSNFKKKLTTLQYEVYGLIEEIKMDEMANKIKMAEEKKD